MTLATLIKEAERLQQAAREARAALAQSYGLTQTK